MHRRLLPMKTAYNAYAVHQVVPTWMRYSDKGQEKNQLLVLS